MIKVINTSLETSIFLDHWKKSIVTPIEKQCEEFRPINSLKTCEKIIEKVVKDQLEKYIENRYILSKNQSEFRKKHSCETTVKYGINEFKAVAKDKRIIALFLDVKRALETIYREIILNKLYMYGIRGTELEWLKSYMKRRRQTTKSNDIESDEIINNFGMPQGSILGALLFIIYMNNMPSILEKCKVVFYVEDTPLYTVAKGDE